MGLRLAVVGKGGVGKTTIAATLARLLARQGRRVLAVDLDTNPGLAWSLGIPRHDEGLPAEAVEEHAGSPYGWRLDTSLSPAEAVDRYAIVGPDGVRYLSPGKIDRAEHGVRRSMTAVRQILGGFDRQDWDVIADLEAGTTTVYEQYHGFARRVLLVVVPGRGARLVGERLRTLVDGTPVTRVFNRVSAAAPGDDVVVPEDEAVREADRRGVPVIDLAARSAAVLALDRLAKELVSEEAR